VVLAARVELTVDQQAELRGLANSPDVPATVGTRARIVWWRAEGRRTKDVATLAGVSRPTVDLGLARYARDGIGGLLDHRRGAGREQQGSGKVAFQQASSRLTGRSGLRA
jgi:hypothetical protein